MSGGPLFPFSSYPAANGKIFPNPHIGASNNRVDFGMGVMASLDGDSVWHLRFKMPPTIPSGTLKLVLVGLAAATTGNAKVNPSWAAGSLDFIPDTLSLSAEGTTTIAWAAGYSDKYLETKITLDATSVPTANQILVVNMTFETASWTLAVKSTWQAFLIWE